MVTEVECRPVCYPWRGRVIQIVLALVVFFSGILMGSGGTLVLLRQKFTHAQWNSPAVRAASIALRLQRKHHLTDEETQRVEQALGRRMRAGVESRQEFLAQFKATRERFLEDMKAALPPAKYELLERKLETRQRRMRWFFGLPEESQESPPGGAKTEPEQK